VSLAVIDASVFAVFYAADDPRRIEVTDRLITGDALFAPAHLDAEVVSALRGMARGNPVLDRAVPRALAHLAAFPLRRMPLAPLFERMWELTRKHYCLRRGVRGAGRASRQRADHVRRETRGGQRSALLLRPDQLIDTPRA